MANFKIMRNGLNTEIVGDPHIGQSSEDVTVEVTDDGTYQEYDKNLYYSYVYRNQIYRAIAEKNSSGEFVIPVAAFLEPGLIKLSVELSNGMNKPTCNACFISVTNGAKSVAASDILPDDATWEQYVESYVKSHADTFKGEKGEKGEKGDTGPQGPQGPQGEKGDTGDSDYKPAVDELGKRIDNLKEDLESKFEVVSESFVNKCSIIRNNVPNNMLNYQVTGVKQYFDFGKDTTLTKIKTNIKASNDDIAVLEIATLDGNIIATKEKAVTSEYTDVVFELENILIKEPVSVFVYTKGSNMLSYGQYGTPYDNPSFSYIFPDGTRKLALKFGTIETNPTNSDNKQCLVLFFDYASKTIKSVPDSIAQNIDTTLSESGKSADAKVVGEKIKNIENSIDNTLHNILYVSTTGNDETGDGTEENPFATIYHANEVITDNSENNRYRIIVKQGTYTDLQEKYAGIDGTHYQGVTCKSYVTYESEDITRPDLCILKWDGSVGYTKPVTDANCVNKCLFHVKGNSQGVYIKGFTFVSKNTRYCMHVETVGSTKACDWHFENCVFEWGGRPDTTDDGTVATSCIGTGWSLMEYGEFVNCIIKCTNTNHANHMVFQTHGNVDTGFSSIKRGEYIKFINCYFSVADGSDYAHVDLRNTKANPTIPSFIEFINCAGIKLYVPSVDYRKNFVCTEQHT